MDIKCMNKTNKYEVSNISAHSQKLIIYSLWTAKLKQDI